MKGIKMHFNELNLSQELLQAVEELGFTEMTEIQEKVSPYSSGHGRYRTFQYRNR